MECKRALLQVESKDRNHARHLILDKINKVENQRTSSNKIERNTLNTLNKKLVENNLLVLKSDKGNTTVLMHKDEYIKKTENPTLI